VVLRTERAAETGHHVGISQRTNGACLVDPKGEKTMNITVECFDEADDQTEGHRMRVQPGAPLDAPVAGSKRLVPAGAISLDVSVEGHAIVIRTTDDDQSADTDDDDDDAEGHLFRKGRLVELQNDIVEVSDGNGTVRRYMRVGGSQHRPDAMGMKYRLGGGPRV
jgi:hypothetical protein